MKFSGVVAYVDDIYQLKFQLKVRKGVGSIGVQKMVSDAFNILFKYAKISDLDL
jgi:hypothetical protein